VLKSTTGQALLSLASVVAVFFILPRFGTPATMLGCATILTLYLSLFPGFFRSRNGSLGPAICLASAMWLAAAAVSALSLSEGR